MQRDEEIRYRRAIFANVFQIVLVIAYCMTTFLLSIASERNANDLSACLWALAPHPSWPTPIRMAIRIGVGLGEL